MHGDSPLGNSSNHQHFCGVFLNFRGVVHSEFFHYGSEKNSISQQLLRTVHRLYNAFNVCGIFCS